MARVWLGGGRGQWEGNDLMDLLNQMDKKGSLGGSGDALAFRVSSLLLYSLFALFSLSFSLCVSLWVFTL